MNQTQKRPFVKPIKNTSEVRTPPQSLEAEEAVLAAMMLDKRALLEVRNILTEQDFYREAHRKLFRAMIALDDRNIPTDIVSIQEELKRTDDFDMVGGMATLTALIDHPPTAANAEHHAQIVLEKSFGRTFIRKCSQAIGDAYALEDPLKVCEDLMAELVKGNSSKKGFLDPQEFSRTIANEMMEGGRSKYIPTGYASLDSKLGGIRLGHIGVITGPAEQGKSTFFANIAVNVARQKKKVTHLILEDDAVNVMHRQVCLANGINIQNFESQDQTLMASGRKLDAYEKWANLGISLGDKLSVGCTWDSVKLQIMRQIKRVGIDLLLIEGAELLEVKIRQGENKSDAEARLANELDTIAQENEIAVWLIIGKGKSDEGFKAVGSNSWWKIQRQSLHIKQHKDAGKIPEYANVSLVEIGKSNDRKKWRDPFYFETIGDTFRWRELEMTG